MAGENLAAGGLAMSDREFARFQRWIRDIAGIHLGDAKKALVESRLARRVRDLALHSYTDYLKRLSDAPDPEETQIAIDLLTTNETFFFREPKHFDFLRNWLTSHDRPGRHWRVWCGAASSGEEPYSIAMTLADVLGPQRWEVLGTDISVRVLRAARRGIYPMNRLSEFPPGYLKRFCLKGEGAYAGSLLVSRGIRERVRFDWLNLNEALPDLGSFDLVFLRNVLIYFEPETKADVIARVTAPLAPGGCFIVSHSESLIGLTRGLVQQGAGVYRKA